MLEKAEILSRFEKVYKSGEDEYQCLCPAHNDTSASLGLKFKEDKLIGNCFAGCSWHVCNLIVLFSTAQILLCIILCLCH